MNFKNTYINTSEFSIEDINHIGKKYCDAVLKEDPKADTGSFWYDYGVENRWNYLAVQPTGYVEIFDEIPSFVITEITEQDLDNYLQQKENTMNCPAFDFKINLSNMTEAEKEVAKKWLVSVADSRSMRCFPEYWGSRNLVTVDKKYIDCVQVGRDHKELNHLPELFLTFSKPTITSWETPSKKSEKECQRLLQLEELVGKLQQQLKEAEQQLESLK